MTPRRVRDDAVSVTMARASIRDATPEDYDAFAQFFSELHAPEPVPSARVYEGNVAPRAFFAVESGNASGFLCWRAGSRLDRDAVEVASPEVVAFHVSILAVRPERRRRGLGRQLMLEAARRARAQGFTRWQLHVGVDNGAAQALYKQLGMVVLFENVLLELDAALALRLSAVTSGAPHVHIVGRFGEPAPAVTGDGPVRVVVQGDDALAGTLRAEGGLVTHRTLRMAGEIPESP
jgi:ribosomal protein S18 acetylase RimI-like enzyme